MNPKTSREEEPARCEAPEEDQPSAREGRREPGHEAPAPQTKRMAAWCGEPREKRKKEIKNGQNLPSTQEVNILPNAGRLVAAGVIFVSKIRVFKKRNADSHPPQSDR